MHGYQLADFNDAELSVAMTEATDRALAIHLDKGPDQEDLTFAYWRPSRGSTRYSAILHQIVLPGEGDRLLHGNVAFTAQYLQRVIRSVPEGCGIALLHSHLGPGWQNMSRDDEVAERERMGGAVAARTQLPVLGLTRGTDGVWSARFWLRARTNTYERRWASTVRVVGKQLRMSYHPTLRPDPRSNPAQEATVSVWGSLAQADLVRAHVGIIGLGSVGSIVAESLSRTGLQRLTFLDHDLVEQRNLDRMLGATSGDVTAMTPKVKVAERTARDSHTASEFRVSSLPFSLLTESGLAAALDCDALMSCVDRPLPRHVLNVLAKAHLIPVVDGGILARVDDKTGKPLHVDWRIHTVGPGRSCSCCLSALRRSDVSLDRNGLLDDPDYVDNMPLEERQVVNRRNIFAFSLSVAAHQTLQLIGLITGMARIGGTGSQHYSAYPGRMTVEPINSCDPDCDIDECTATALDLSSNVQTDQLPTSVTASS